MVMEGKDLLDAYVEHYLAQDRKKRQGEYYTLGKFIEEYYNEIEISYTAAKAHPKSAFQMRNREMVDRADLVICYIENKEGGAWQTIKYAKINQTTLN